MIPITKDKVIKLKVNLIGTTMVGKTTILNVMRRGVFNPDTIATVGASFVTLIKDDINYQVWDTAGQERYLSLIPMYFRDVKITIFVFDVNEIRSIKYINRYKDILIDDPDIRIIILGNKTDLLEEKEEEKNHLLEELTKEVYNNFEILMLTDKIHGLYFISAKDGNNFNKFLEHFHECGKNSIFNNPKNNNIVDNICIRNPDVTIETKEDRKCC